MKPVFLFDHPLFRQHETGPGHPERPERLDAIVAGIRKQGLEEKLEWVTPSQASRADLERVHTGDYVERILGMRGRSESLDPDTVVSPASVDAAMTASGACMGAVDRILTTPGASAFCLSRPPGHHAERDRAMGFCLFNHVAVGAAYAIAQRGLSRVLIFDPDVHHGNGTQDIFYERWDVCYVSIHQWPLFPGTGLASETGAGDGKGYTVNIPLPAGAGDSEYLAAVNEEVLPVVRSFQPEMVIFSAGFDAHEKDPLGGMQVTTEGFLKFHGLIFEELERLQVPCFFSLEGGYSLEALEEVVPALLGKIQGGGGSNP